MALKDVTLHLQRFGRWTVIAQPPYPSDKRGVVRLECRCECGIIKMVRADYLGNGKSKSCGCSRRAKGKNQTHGQTGTPTYRAWINMLQRCNNPDHPNYPYYGGRGITVCEQWRSFSGFLADVGDRPSANVSLHRIDNDGPYVPDNVCWATADEQRRGKRAIAKPSDEWLTVAEAARLCDMAPLTIKRAVHCGQLEKMHRSGRILIHRNSIDLWQRRNDGLLTVVEAAAHLGISRQRVDQIMKAGKLSPEPGRDQYLFRPEELERWANEVRGVPSKPPGRPKKRDEPEAAQQVLKRLSNQWKCNHFEVIRRLVEAEGRRLDEKTKRTDVSEGSSRGEGRSSQCDLFGDQRG